MTDLIKAPFAALALAALAGLAACGHSDRTVIVNPEPGQAVVVPHDGESTTVVTPPK